MCTVEIFGSTNAARSSERTLSKQMLRINLIVSSRLSVNSRKAGDANVLCAVSKPKSCNEFQGEQKSNCRSVGGRGCVLGCVLCVDAMLCGHVSNSRPHLTLAKRSAGWLHFARSRRRELRRSLLQLWNQTEETAQHLHAGKQLRS